MTKEKQIEDMTSFLWKNTNIASFLTCDGVAKDLVEGGYRKASDVAREIFEEIEKVFGVDLWLGSTPWKYADYERLKKRYTESEKDNDTH